MDINTSQIASKRVAYNGKKGGGGCMMVRTPPKSREDSEEIKENIENPPIQQTLALSTKINEFNLVENIA